MNAELRWDGKFGAKEGNITVDQPPKITQGKVLRTDLFGEEILFLTVTIGTK